MIDDDPSRRLRSATRWRAGFAVATILLPLALLFLFERQARRLDELAAHGKATTGRVTAVSRDDGSTFYVYWVNRTKYSWNVAREEAPFAIVDALTVTYLPRVPSFSRPVAGRTLAAAEAVHNRSFAWKLLLGVSLTLGVFALMSHREVRRLRAGAPSKLTDPRAYRRRLALTALALFPLLLLIGGYHISDALARGEPAWPGAVALGAVDALIGGIFLSAARRGPAEAQARSARLLRWLVPIAAALALLRLVATLLLK